MKKNPEPVRLSEKRLMRKKNLRDPNFGKEKNSFNEDFSLRIYLLFSIENRLKNHQGIGIKLIIE